MGYYVDMSTIDVIIPADKRAAALDAINAMFTPERLEKEARGGSFNGSGYTEKWYSWVTNPPNGKFDTLEEALLAWRFSTIELDDGGLELDYSDSSKLGQEELLFENIAPFVNDGGEVRCVGEDNTYWRWRFANGTLVEECGEVVYG
jgi:hypothetical protein